MAKTISAAMTAHINREVLTLATCWHITRTDGVELFFTDHDRDIVYAGDTYLASTGIARTSIESKGDMSVDNLDIIGVIGGSIDINDLKAGFYDFAAINIVSVNWQDPDAFGPIPLRVGTLGEIQAQDGGYKAEMRGIMQMLERRRGKVYTPDCRANLFSVQVNPFSARADGCGLSSTPFEEYGEVLTVDNDRKFTCNEFSRLRVTPTFPVLDTSGAQVRGVGDIRGVREADYGYVEMVLDVADSTPMRPTVITDRTGLENIANNLYGNYVLGNDIALAAVAWTPIGDRTRPFMGTFDGMGYKITKLRVSATDPEPAGLFGACGGILRRVGIQDVTSATGAATSWAGALCGILYGDDSSDYPVAGGGLIEGCWASHGFVTTNNDFAGGLVGLAQKGTVIRESAVYLLISGSVGTDVGAIVGRAEGTYDVDRWVSGVFANTDIASTTDLGNINGVTTGYAGLTDAEWIVESNFSSEPAWDLNDRWVMNTIPSTAATVSFVDSNPDTVTRAAGNFTTDGVKPGDHITFSGTASNDTTYIIRQVFDTTLRFDAAEAVVVEGPVACTYTCAGGPRPMNPGRL